MSKDVLKTYDEAKLSFYSTEELLEELERRNFKVTIKILGVDVACFIGNKEFEVRAD